MKFDLVTIESAVGGAYEMPDGRKFWVDAAVAAEIARRVKAAQLYEMRRLIRLAMTGPGVANPYNSFYMGSMATSTLMGIFGVSYGAAGFDEALDAADERKLSIGLTYCQPYLEALERRAPRDNGEAEIDRRLPADLDLGALQ